MEAAAMAKKFDELFRSEDFVDSIGTLTTREDFRLLLSNNGVELTNTEIDSLCDNVVNLKNKEFSELSDDQLTNVSGGSLTIFGIIAVLGVVWGAVSFGWKAVDYLIKLGKR